MEARRCGRVPADGPGLNWAPCTCAVISCRKERATAEDIPHILALDVTSSQM